MNSVAASIIHREASHRPERAGAASRPHKYCIPPNTEAVGGGVDDCLAHSHGEGQELVSAVMTAK